MVPPRLGSFVAFGFAASVFASVACGGAKPEPVVSARPAATTAPAPPSKVSSLRRKEVREVIDRGLGYVLSKVEIGAEPHRKDGAFVGFVIEGFRDPDLFVGVDLIPGDVITHVNGQKIERPEQAMAAFESLGKAKELRVSLERKGAPRELVLPIVD
jgi:type II secretory pathway component PulC